MRTIKNIKIENAELESFSVSLGKEKPEVNATIALMTAGGKKITSYTISTGSWNDEQKFELPLEIIAPILGIAEILEGVVAEHCDNITKKLT